MRLGYLTMLLVSLALSAIPTAPHNRHKHISKGSWPVERARERRGGEGPLDAAISARLWSAKRHRQTPRRTRRGHLSQPQGKVSGSATPEEGKYLGGGSCPNCLGGRARPDELRLEAIKSQILAKLGLSSPPNVSASLPRELVLQTVTRAEEGAPPRTQHRPHPPHDPDPPDDSSEIIAFAEPGSRVNGQTLLEFPFPAGAAGAELRVKSATLWLRVNQRRGSHPETNVTFWVFRILLQLPNATTLNSKEFDEYTEMSTSEVVRAGAGGWHRLNMTAAVGRWYGERRPGPLRLLVDCSGCARGRLQAPWAQQFSAGPEARPFLAVRTEPGPHRRLHRRALECSGATRGQCCKQRFYVSFKAIGWDDWVIAPSGYYANYCRGECSPHRSLDMSPNHHSTVMDRMRPLEGLQPCCAPVRFSSASLIYWNEDNVIKKDLPKMVVEECGCP